MITLLFVLVCLGVLLYLLSLIPLDKAILALIRVVVIVVAVFYTLSYFVPVHVPWRGLR